MRRHPQLAKKLTLLYSLRLNPSIRSHADLAEVLGISRQAVGKWARGTETSQGDAIPLSQVENVAAIFGISEHWFSLEFDAFEAKVYEKLEAESRLDVKKPEKISVSLMPNTPAKIYGRKAELKELDSEWNERKTNVVQLIAFGGMGKSSLVNAWLSRLDQKGYCGARQVYAWSFYWQAAKSEVRSSGDYFIEHALTWFGDESPAEGSPWEKATRLANLIRSKRTLLVLDGLEPMQYPPGPKHGLVENPAVSLLLKELATENSGLCVVTSRLPVADLVSFEGQRVKSISLDPLSEKSSIKMLKAMGVHGAHADYVQAVNEYSGHPLSLSLLGGYLNVVHRGHIGEFRKISSLLEEQEKGVHARNLMCNYLNWFQDTPERALLFMIGLFDREVSVDDIQKISQRNAGIEGLTADLSILNNLQYSYAIDRLRQANLIYVKAGDVILTLDCHPLVRDFLSGFLKENYPYIWKLGHNLIFNFLVEQSKEHPNSISELEPLFRAVIHGTQAECYEEAFSLYFEKIKKRYTMLTEGNHHTDQACLRSFNDSASGLPVSELREESRFYLLSSSAANLISLGKIDDAIEPGLKSISWFLSKKKWIAAINAAGPYISMLIVIGRLNEAIELMQGLEECVQKSNNIVVSAMSDCFKAHAQHLAGNDDRALEYFEKSERILTLDNPGIPVTFPTISSYYCKFLLDTGRTEEALERSLKTFSWRSRNSWQVLIDTTSLLASDMQILGLAFLAANDKFNASVYLNKQVDLLQEADEWLYLPSGLNARAELHMANRDWKLAKADLAAALEISQRTGARFGEWESALNFVRLYATQGDLEAASEYLEHQTQIPDMSMYRFRDKDIKQLERQLTSSDSGSDSPPAHDGDSSRQDQTFEENELS